MASSLNTMGAGIGRPSSSTSLVQAVDACLHHGLCLSAEGPAGRWANWLVSVPRNSRTLRLRTRMARPFSEARLQLAAPVPAGATKNKTTGGGGPGTK